MQIQHHIFPWNSDRFIQHLSILGFALIATSVMYLVAANWLMLPHWAQLLIPQSLLLLSAVASIFLSKHDFLVQTFNTICGLMMGLSLAVIGQIYQTGADSYLLFLVWSVLLLAWLYRYNIGVFLLLCVISQIALFLFFKQTFWGDQFPVLFLVALNIVTGLQFYFCLKYYPKLRYIFILWVSIFSIWHMWSFLYGDGEIAFLASLIFTYLDIKIAYLISSFFLLSISLFYFYKKKDQLCSVLSAVGLGVVLTFCIVDVVSNLFSNSEIFQLFFIALVIFAWFALISYLLVKALPNSRFNMIPLAVGAWIAGLILASLMLTFWENFSLIMGLLFVFIAIYILKKKQSLFLRQLAYCLFIAGQVAFLFHLGLLIEEIFPILLLQIGFLVLSYFLRMHWFFIFMQLLGTYAVGFATILNLNDAFKTDDFSESLSYIVLLKYLFFVLVLCISKIMPSQYQRSVLLAILMIILYSVFFEFVVSNFIGLAVQHHSVLFYGLPVIWFTLFVCLFLLKQLNIYALIILTAFATVFIVYGYFEIFIVLSILAWAIQRQDKLIYGFSLTCLVFLLGFLYYNLQITFLVKSASIFFSGLSILALAYLLNKLSMTEERIP
ncbi:DUF2157 domain-containing protein [Acinetobacter sp. ANC 3832]|uniref:DUF2157 domain-containing protein n=1 Tax=Acinetobacter sp. ANC 3832 TaxID=1977874 RepID=UPI000A33A59E|nr:DUF2157 domain-containing protein [Acinetobacter sp. ANC 3832]OTG93845.1 hypothetical protein B9T35_09090 [Acinetobacter sp. ANC 3832]